MAGATQAVRQELTLRLGAAGFDLASVVEDAAELRTLLFTQPQDWVLTGGRVQLARPFVRAAIDAELPVLALVSGDRSSLRGILSRGAAGLLGPASSPQAMRAAAVAICQGLVVWEPDEEPDAPLVRTPEALSPRERAVLEHVAAGLSNKVIARKLSISPNTVKFHLQAAFDKLGVNTRARAVAVAIGRGELAV